MRNGRHDRVGARRLGLSQLPVSGGGGAAFLPQLRNAAPAVRPGLRGLRGGRPARCPLLRGLRYHLGKHPAGDPAIASAPRGPGGIALLVIDENGRELSRHPMSSDETTIGRGDADVAFPEDQFLHPCTPS